MYVYDILPWYSRSVHQWTEYTVLVASLFFNASLARLLATERNRVLRAYARVIYVNAAVDVAFSIVSAITVLEYEAPPGHIIFMLNGPIKAAKMPVQYAGMFVWLVTATASTSFIPLVSLFRYCVIIRQRPMTSRQIGGFLLAALATSVHQAFFFTLCTYVNHSHRLEDCRRLLLAYEVWSHDGVQNCMIANPNSPLVYYSLAAGSAVNMTCYTIMAYCTIKSLRFAIPGDVSVKAQRLQKELNVLLTVQMIIPMFTFFLPLAITLTVPQVVGFFVPGTGVFSSIALLLLPLGNPITTIFLISNFRRRFMRSVNAVAVALTCGQKNEVGPAGRPSELTPSSVAGTVGGSTIAGNVRFRKD